MITVIYGRLLKIAIMLSSRMLSYSNKNALLQAFCVSGPDISYN